MLTDVGLVFLLGAKDGLELFLVAVHHLALYLENRYDVHPIPFIL